ncbi:hypothetical protein M0813_15063 [Anaeramoeba flamelloides]|uniref:Uncharacterized protein n=1 Tax=Anaeramoeba flamelloides TaxID=1746091 RepID=A0ABQ8Z3E6_9EUKA|nr:hypothetical protein M0813_15063 [Anaeramoeba flamelloides]
MTTTKTQLKESFNSLHYNKEQNVLIRKFMTVTHCRIFDAILYLNLSDWDYHQAIGTQVLCELSNLAKKKKTDGEILNRSQSFVYSKDIKFKLPTKNKNKKNVNDLLATNNSLLNFQKKNQKIQKERKRNFEEIKSSSCPNVMKVFKSNNKRNSSKKNISRSLTLQEIQGSIPFSRTILQKFITQKPAPRWRHRLTAFTKLNPSLTEGWPSCFKDFNSADENEKPIRKLIVKKDLFDLYKEIHKGICIKNLQRGLITFMGNQGFMNLSNPEQDFYLFVSYEPVYF